jgi:hypothetical protein
MYLLLGLESHTSTGHGGAAELTFPCGLHKLKQYTLYDALSLSSTLQFTNTNLLYSGRKFK